MDWVQACTTATSVSAMLLALRAHRNAKELKDQEARLKLAADVRLRTFEREWAAMEELVKASAQLTGRVAETQALVAQVQHPGYPAPGAAKLTPPFLEIAYRALSELFIAITKLPPERVDALAPMMTSLRSVDEKLGELAKLPLAEYPEMLGAVAQSVNESQLTVVAVVRSWSVDLWVQQRKISAELDARAQAK